MGYRIHFSHLHQDDTLSAVVSGKPTLAAAGCIARDIAARAARECARRVLVDLRWLEDRVGMRSLLALPELRVAVLDAEPDDRYCGLSERGELRYFGSPGAAMSWLRADPRSPRGDRKAPTPGGARPSTPLEIYGG
jgi:hypothetical protein